MFTHWKNEIKNRIQHIFPSKTWRYVQPINPKKYFPSFFLRTNTKNNSTPLKFGTLLFDWNENGVWFLLEWPYYYDSLYLHFFPPQTKILQRKKALITQACIPVSMSESVGSVTKHYFKRGDTLKYSFNLFLTPKQVIANVE